MNLKHEKSAPIALESVQIGVVNSDTKPKRPQKRTAHITVTDNRKKVEEFAPPNNYEEDLYRTVQLTEDLFQVRSYLRIQTVKRQLLKGEKVNIHTFP